MHWLEKLLGFLTRHERRATQRGRGVPSARAGTRTARPAPARPGGFFSGTGEAETGCENKRGALF